MANSVRIGSKFDDNISGPLAKLRDKFDQLGASKGAQSILMGVGVSVGTAAMSALGSAVGVVTDKLGEGIRSAIEEERSLAGLSQALDVNVLGWREHSAAIDDAILRGQRLAFTDDEMRESLKNLAVRTKDVSRALDLQRTSMDLARLKGIDLATATGIVGKVYGGNIGILGRYGIAVEKGASATEALAGIQRQAQGQAETYGATTEGAFAAATVAIDELFESLGTELLPVLGEFAVMARDDIIPALRDMIATAKELAPVWEVLGAAVDVIINGPLARLDDTLADLDEQTRTLSETEVRELAEGAKAWDRHGEGATSSLAGTGKALGTFAAKSRSSFDGVIRDIRALETEFATTLADLRSIASGAASAIWDPIILMDELAANSREIADQRRILSSSIATKAEKQDAEARIHVLQREQMELTGTATAMGKIPKAQAEAFKKKTIEQWADATGDARRQLQQLINKLYEMDKASDDAFSDVGKVGSGFKHQAHGGTNVRGDWSIVGEQGPELVHWPAASRVFSNQDSRAMLSGSSGGAMPATVIQLVVDGRVLAEVTEPHLARRMAAGSR